jgi:hypothetical protein
VSIHSRYPPFLVKLEGLPELTSLRPESSVKAAGEPEHQRSEISYHRREIDRA